MPLGRAIADPGERFLHAPSRSPPSLRAAARCALDTVKLSSWAAGGLPVDLLRCRFGRDTVRASRGADGQLVCHSPAAPPHGIERFGDHLDGLERADGRAPPRIDPETGAHLTMLGDAWVTEDALAANPFFAQDAGIVLRASADDEISTHLEASTNAQDFTASALRWRWLPEPTFEGLEPASGPIEGGTRVRVVVRPGSGRCRTCSAASATRWSRRPSAPTGTARRGGDARPHDDVHLTQQHAGVAPLAVTLNAKLRRVRPQLPVLPDARVASVHPLLGPTEGGTLIAIGGALPSGGSEYVCRFGRTSHPASQPQLVAARRPASADDAGLAGAALCSTPSVVTVDGAAANVSVELSLNAQQFVAVPTNFTYHPPMLTTKLAPLSGPAAGGTELLVIVTRGALVAAAVNALSEGAAREGVMVHRLLAAHVCRFGGVVDYSEQPAAIANLAVALPNYTAIADAVRARRPPSAPPPPTAPSPMLPGNQSNGTVADFPAAADLDAAAATAIDAAITAEVYSEVAAAVAASLAAVTNTSDDRLPLRCVVPPAAVIGVGDAARPPSPLPNAQDFSASATAFQLYEDPRVSAVAPTTGPSAGDTLLTIHGAALRRRRSASSAAFARRRRPPGEHLGRGGRVGDRPLARQPRAGRAAVARPRLRRALHRPRPGPDADARKLRQRQRRSSLLHAAGACLRAARAHDLRGARECDRVQRDGGGMARRGERQWPAVHRRRRALHPVRAAGARGGGPVRWAVGGARWRPHRGQRAAQRLRVPLPLQRARRARAHGLRVRAALRGRRRRQRHERHERHQRDGASVRGGRRGAVRCAAVCGERAGGGGGGRGRGPRLAAGLAQRPAVPPPINFTY